MKVNINSGTLRKVLMLLLMLVLGYLITFQSPSNILSRRYIFSDSSVYQLVARTMVEGGAPYKDIFDHKGIVFYFINMFAYIMHPKFGIWFLEWLCMAANCYLSYKICRTWNSPLLALLITVMGYSCIVVTGYWIGNTPEIWALPFLLITELIFINYYYEAQLTKRDLVILGICGSCILLMKPTMAVVFPIYIIVVLFKSIRDKQWQIIKNSVIYFLIGIFIISIPSFIYLFVKGAFSDFINDYLLFNMQYSATNSNMEASLKVLLHFLSLPAFALGAGCLLITPYLIGRDNDKDLSFLLIHLCAFCGLLYIIVKPGREYVQYTAIAYPVLFSIIGLTSGKIKSRVLRIGAFAFVTLIFLFNLPVIVENWRSIFVPEYDRIEIVKFLEANCDKDESITVVTPDDCWVYLMADRKSATRFPYTQADIMLNNAQPDILQLYFEDIDQNKPKYIIANQYNDWFQQFVCMNIKTTYVPIGANGRYIVYERE